MSLREVKFTLASFTELLRVESLRCVRVALERRWLVAVPERFLYYLDEPPLIHHPFPDQNSLEVTLPAERVLTGSQLVPHLFREDDSFFRSEILLSPFALLSDTTVLDVRFRDPSWTKEVIAGELAFPNEPFQIRGPALPVGWRSGQGIPTVTLPRLRLDPIQGKHSLGGTP